MPPQNEAFEVQQFDAANWKQHSRMVQKNVPEPQQGEVLVAPYLRPVNPTDFILVQTGWGSIPAPAVPGSEGLLQLSGLSCCALRPDQHQRR